MYRNCIKRLLDIIIALLVIIVGGIPMLIIAAAIRLESEGPAIFKQERLGKNKRVYTMYKFRSMKQDSEHTGSGVYSNSEDPRLALLMSMAPLEKRISDALQNDIIMINNNNLFKVNVRVQTLDVPVYNYVLYPDSMSHSDSGYEKKLKRIEENETIQLETVQRIDMPENEKTKYIKHIKAFHAKIKMYNARTFRNTEEFNKYLKMAHKYSNLDFKDCLRIIRYKVLKK